MGKKTPFFTIAAVAFLITGNLIGAGILGLPVNTGIDGMIPSLVAMVVFGGAMFFSAVVLGKEAIQTKEENFNFPSLYHKYTGNVGKWVAILANMLILYGLLTAYLTGGSTIVCKIFNISDVYAKGILVLIFLILSGLTLSGNKIIHRFNAILMILLWGSFAIIVFIGQHHVDPVRLKHCDWGFLPVAIPIIVTAFHFHNIIPNVCHSLNWDIKAVAKAMLIGMCIGFLMNAIWIQVGIGMLPLSGGESSIIYCYKNNIPANVPMAEMVNSSTFTLFSMLFALLAIATSFVANGIGLLGFNRDLLFNFFKVKSNMIVSAVTFLPPLIIALIYPDIFLKAINVVGGVGIVTLFGILPCIIAFIKTRRRSVRIFSVVLLLLFSAVLLVQLGEDFGIIDIQPEEDEVYENVMANFQHKALPMQPEMPGIEYAK
ncbi:aromatic amino acid transport family protein [Lentisphaerota bacterium ZTH]|nr:tryptophan/tyrosine permease [Lentisphaerota bacterium]WET06891.1 aromatic amino acid transport family protein [Lentisphaerota bacterium ZTH]